MKANLNRIASLFLLSTLVFATALAEPNIPSLPAPPVKAQQDPPKSQSVADLVASLEAKLSTANDELTAAMNLNPGSGDGKVAENDEILERRYDLQQIARGYQREIDTLSKVQHFQQSLDQLEEEMSRWKGLSHQPPFSFLMVDALREAVRFQTTHVEALQSIVSFMEQEMIRRKDSLKEATGKLRQANEHLESQETPRKIWLRDSQSIRTRLAEVRVETLEMEQKAVNLEKADAQQRLDFANTQLKAVNGQIAFPDADKEQTRRRLQFEKEKLQKEMDLVHPLAQTARQALADSQGKTDDSETEDSLLLQREQTENTLILVQVLNRLIDNVVLRLNLWELRWSDANQYDMAKLEKSYGYIERVHLDIQPIREHLQERLKLTSTQLFETDKQLLDPASTVAASQNQKLRVLFNERVSIYQRLLEGLDITDHLLDLWQQDLDDKHARAPFIDRSLDLLAGAEDMAGNVWAFELFAVEDSIEVEGQTITGKRSVTLGKVITALLILVVGLWFAGLVTRFVETQAVNRNLVEVSTARIGRRWIMFLIGLFLLVISLLMVKIPLTVFAFTGGAVAIGLGFGMQNLLKNLISGLMLLLERPFRPGDLIEVNGMRGRVIDIGMRSSHIRDGNGIETLIPNSTFIEENVTNWTLSSQSVRIAVKVGVAYGSNPQEVTEILLNTAERHGLVQDKPAPDVVFEDFGSDALIFGLYVWVEIKMGVDWRVIASDLRYMLYKTLTSKGVVLAFPQRDIHLDASQPLPVRILKE